VSEILDDQSKTVKSSNKLADQQELDSDLH